MVYSALEIGLKMWGIVEREISVQADNDSDP